MADSRAWQVAWCFSSQASQLGSVGAFLRAAIEAWISAASCCFLSM